MNELENNADQAFTTQMPRIPNPTVVEKPIRLPSLTDSVKAASKATALVAATPNAPSARNYTSPDDVKVDVLIPGDNQTWQKTPSSIGSNERTTVLGRQLHLQGNAASNPNGTHITSDGKRSSNTQALEDASDTVFKFGVDKKTGETSQRLKQQEKKQYTANSADWLVGFRKSLFNKAQSEARQRMTALAGGGKPPMPGEMPPAPTPTPPQPAPEPMEVRGLSGFDNRIGYVAENGTVMIVPKTLRQEDVGNYLKDAAQVNDLMENVYL